MGVRTFVFGLICFLAAANFGVSAQAAGSNITIANVPACSIRCLLINIPASGCGIADTACRCTNPELARTVSECMLEKCKTEEMIITSKVQANLCHFPEESKSREVFLAAVIGYLIAIFCIGLRLWGKVIAGRLAIDDWVCVGGLLGTAIPLGCSLKSRLFESTVFLSLTSFPVQSLGFGMHLWAIQNAADLTEILLLSTTYIIFLGSIKASLVLLYVEIFPDKRTRTAAYIILILIITNTLGIFISSIFLCTPVRGFWEIDLHAKCSNMNAIGYAVSGSFIGQDLILLIFPLVCIRNLNMKRKQKLAVGLMFCIGTFGCITTFLRLHTLLKFKTSVDPTWDYADVTNWSTLELLTGFICVSLPSIRLLFIHYLPKNVFPTLTSASTKSLTTFPYDEYDKKKNNGEKQKHDWWDSVSIDNFDNTTSTQDVKKGLGRSPSHRLWPGSHITSTKSKVNGLIRSKSKLHSSPHCHQQLRESFTMHPEVSLTHVQTATPKVPDSRMTSVIAKRISSMIVSSHENFEMRSLRMSSRHVRLSGGDMCSSCGSHTDFLTALPQWPQIGCLPDDSFSRLEDAEEEDAEEKEEEEEGEGEERSASTKAKRMGSVWAQDMV